MSVPFDSTPPRKIGFVPYLVTLNSGPMAQIGWLLMGFGLVFFWIFFMNSEILSLFDGDDWIETQARVTRVSPTNFSENESTVWKVQFEYEVNGQSYLQTAYGTGYTPQEGNTVRVEYDPKKPYMARMEGLRRRPFGVFASFTLVFPLAGLLFVVFGYRRNLLNLFLLLRGHFTTGTVIDKEATNTTVNEERVYKITFEFADKRGRTHQVSTRSHEPEKLLDDVHEPILYLAERPELAVLFDSISPKPTIQENGGDSMLTYPGLSLIWLVLPALTLIAHGLYVWFRYFSS